MSMRNSETCSPFEPWPSYTQKSAICRSPASGYVMKPRSWLIFADALPYIPGLIPWLLYVHTLSGGSGLTLMNVGGDEPLISIAW